MFDWSFWVVIGVFVAFMIVLVIGAENQTADFSAQCKSQGGYPLHLEDQWICMKTDLIIPIERK